MVRVMNIKFNLRKGMTTKELFNELHGKTAGENQRERAILFAEWQKSPLVPLESIGPYLSKGKVDSLGLAAYQEMSDQVERNIIEEQVKRKLPKAQVIMEYKVDAPVGPINKFALVLEYSIAEADIFQGSDIAKSLPQYPGIEHDPAKFKKGETKPLIEKGGLIKRFYLVGINDEGMYFVRPLQGIPIEKIKDIKALLSWLNKEDLGYTRRIQGDIVLRFMKHEYVTKEGQTVHNKQYKTNVLHRKTHVSYRLPKNGNNKGFTDWYHMDSVRLGHVRNFGDHRIGVVGNGHIVIPHATGFYAIEPLIVDAREFMMTHSEHESVTVKVPEGYYAVLASQRGRDEITGHGVFD